ncbi:hypothetical protein J3458_002720 [Metarhizium acridum]|uniref:uncharacterized protein n=1 Tax=Metarhizium acridum TaxID=92637 RepID=UPI001C6C809C|nr:hypothetical protein J3458_002720 [Metarhizium acridum]
MPCLANMSSTAEFTSASSRHEQGNVTGTTQALKKKTPQQIPKFALAGREATEGSRYLIMGRSEHGSGLAKQELREKMTSCYSVQTTTITCGSHVVDPWLCWGQATGFACANFEPHPTSGVLTLASAFLRFLF